MAKRWKLRGRDREALRDRADQLNCTLASAKLEQAEIGLIFARAEPSSWKSAEQLIDTAIAAARKELADYGTPASVTLRSGAVFEGESTGVDVDAVNASDDLSFPSDLRPSPELVELAGLVESAAKSPQEQLLVADLRERPEAPSPQESGWSEGHVRGVTSRLRRRLVGE